MCKHIRIVHASRTITHKVMRTARISLSCMCTCPCSCVYTQMNKTSKCPCTQASLTTRPSTKARYSKIPDQNPTITRTVTARNRTGSIRATAILPGYLSTGKRPEGAELIRMREHCKIWRENRMQVTEK